MVKGRHFGMGRLQAVDRDGLHGFCTLEFEQFLVNRSRGQLNEMEKEMEMRLPRSQGTRDNSAQDDVRA